jgi:RNA polymerase sigma factor (sigma-70 family)
MVDHISAHGMTVTCPRKRGPVHGPYAEAWYDEQERAHRVRLTSEGRAKVADYLNRYPHPIALLISMWPSTYRAARAANLSEEEIDALCLEGVALAFVRYDPTRGASIGTAVTWSIRASVGAAVRSARKESIQSAPCPPTIENRNERYLNNPGDFELSTAEGIVAGECSPTSDSECAEEITRYLSQANLTAQERYVLILRFGLTRRSPLSTTAIGFAMGLSTERIRQLQEKAIRKIRRAIGLDIDWRVRTRARILAYLSSLPNPTSENAGDTQTRRAVSKAEICKRAHVTTWQFREIIRRLLREGLVIRERVELSRERWGIVFHLREPKTIP